MRVWPNEGVAKVQRTLPGKVQAHTAIGFRGYQGGNEVYLLYLHEEVTCLGLCAVLEAVGGNVHHKVMQGVLWRGEDCPFLRNLGANTSAWEEEDGEEGCHDYYA